MANVEILSINPGDPDYSFEEFVVLENRHFDKIYLDDWRVIWQEWPSKRKLHEYIFFNWKSHNRSFDKGEKLYLVSGVGRDRFFNIRQNLNCPIKHWLIYTDSSKYICSVPYIKVTLYDDKNSEIDHLFSNQFKNVNLTPFIVIGHGRDNAWKELKEHLIDKQKFEVEAFETDPRSSQSIPDIIADLGSSANMAILVMTGEDEMVNGNLHPRLNVVQELGKFQEKFGNNKTIILAENDVIIPSNNSGIIYIPFEKGNIKASFGDIVATIRREFNML